MGYASDTRRVNPVTNPVISNVWYMQYLYKCLHLHLPHPYSHYIHQKNATGKHHPTRLYIVELHMEQVVNHLYIYIYNH